ncbi:methyl-accepting chemotaxis protein [Anaerobacterium chartisolvens]|uniref:Methyl-accepting chemotaxis protein n=1 Tax=Anaerobacterium chartisolvens TaxID=1297424 RepID=A0A369BHD6_9FIRM|nr:methyl-accepting chemotaxis protein [Anaerobacterium chartisolvens]RCX20963.1 methyl-accepting chemotaxis protein [Anaerobacterium chartisolvens]
MKLAGKTINHLASKIFSIFKKNGTQAISLRTKLLLFIFLTTLLIVASTVYTSLYFFFQYVDRESQLQSAGGVDSFSAQIKEYKSNSLSYANLFASNPVIAAAIDERNADKLVNELQSQIRRTGIDFAIITDEMGNVLLRSYSPSKKGDNIKEQHTVKMALQGIPYSTIETDDVIKLSAIGSAAIVSQGKIIGTVCTGYRLDQDKVVDKIKKMQGTDATVFLGDTRVATTIIKDGKRIVGTRLDSQISNLVLKKSQKFSGKTQILGMAYFASYLPLLNTEGETIGIIFGGKLIESAYSTINQSTAIILVMVLAIMILFMVVISIFIGKSVINPLRIAVDSLEMVADGKLNIDIDDKNIRKDEIGRLLRSLKTTIADLRALIADIAGLGEAVAKASEEMTCSSHKVNKAWAQVADAIAELAKGASEQAVSTEKGNGKIIGIVSGLSQISEDMEYSRDLANAAKGTVQRGEALVKFQEAKMEDTVKMSQNVNTAISELSAKSAQISKILYVIRSIAEQTNLLSLNASIEAARAGNSGRGFAVVAAEIRKLAEQSGESAKRIGQIIENVNSGVENCVTEMTRVENVVNEQSKALNETVMAFYDISQTFEHINNRIETVSEASSTLSENAKQAGDSIGEIAQVSLQSAAGTQEVAAASEEQAVIMNQIEESANELVQIASKLQYSISKFKI